jgi:hypothetical protein
LSTTGRRLRQLVQGSPPYQPPALILLPAGTRDLDDPAALAPSQQVWWSMAGDREVHGWMDGHSALPS